MTPSFGSGGNVRKGKREVPMLDLEFVDMLQKCRPYPLTDNDKERASFCQICPAVPASVQ